MRDPPTLDLQATTHSSGCMIGSRMRTLHCCITMHIKANKQKVTTALNSGAFSWSLLSCLSGKHDFQKTTSVSWAQSVWCSVSTLWRCSRSESLIWEWLFQMLQAAVFLRPARPTQNTLLVPCLVLQLAVQHEGTRIDQTCIAFSPKSRRLEFARTACNCPKPKMLKAQPSIQQV